MVEPLRRGRNALIAATVVHLLLVLAMAPWLALVFFTGSGGGVAEYGLLGVMAAVGAVFEVGWVWFSVCVVRALAERQNWGWIAALVLFGVYLTSMLFVPFAIYGLAMLLQPEARAACGAAPRAA